MDALGDSVEGDVGVLESVPRAEMHDPELRLETGDNVSRMGASIWLGLVATLL